MIYFFHIGYDGSKYRGWQRQPDVLTIQQTLEEKLKRIFKAHITVVGCGRTDAGVHASQYFMHIYLDEPFDFDLKFILNKNLPDDIAVYDILEMEQDNHARYDATSRTYDYFIHSYKDPVLSKYSSHYELEGLDLDLMQKAASIYSKYNDFKSICKQPHLYKHTKCEVSHAKLYIDEHQQRLRFTITADRFLRGMVRLCVYFLLEVGSGRMSMEEFEHMLVNPNEMPDKGNTLPNGLYLSQVEYPYLKILSRNDFCSFLKVGLRD